MTRTTAANPDQMSMCWPIQAVEMAAMMPMAPATQAAMS